MLYYWYMRRILSVFFLYMITVFVPVYGLEIVYPRSQNVTINSSTTFFIGNDDPQNSLKINDETVNLYRTGGFRHNVKLNYGKNIFIIGNNTEKKKYTVYRPKEQPKSDVKIKYYKKSKYGETGSSAILRKTPINRGLNRLQELPQGIILEITGEYKDFYNIRLGRDDSAWIAKNNISIVQNGNTLGKIESIEEINSADLKILKIKLNKKLPYYIWEQDGLELYLFNVENAPFYRFEKYIFQNRLFGYKSYYNDDNELVIEIKKFPHINKKKPLNNIKIMIDAGHGGTEIGTIGCLGTKEKDINLKLAQKLKSELEKLGAQVYMTREEDENVGLYERVTKTNENNADIFISIHNNAFSDSSAGKDISGTEIYYFYPQAKSLANSIMKGINEYAGTKNNGVKGESFAVIRNSQAVSILLEVAYMINPPEDEKLMDEQFQDNVIKGIIKGLEKYLNDK